MTEKFTFRQFQKQYPDDDACLLVILRGAIVDPATLRAAWSGTDWITGRRAFACSAGCHIYPCAGRYSSIPAQSSRFGFMLLTY